MHSLLSAGVVITLLAYAHVRKSLSPLGLVAAAATASAHALHPWGGFIGLLAAFFLSGTFVTKIKHATKATLTTSSTGNKPSTKAPPRGATQVFANSLPATVLVLVHAYYLRNRLSRPRPYVFEGDSSVCLPYPSTQSRPGYPEPNATTARMNILPFGVMAAYATAAADTFASELGILSTSMPVLLPSLLVGRVRRVPPGTNGGVTSVGVLASTLGACLLGLTAMFTIPLCDGTDEVMEARAAFVDYGTDLNGLDMNSRRWSLWSRLGLVVVLTAVGVTGGLMDSLLGAWTQASVVEERSGKVVESDHGGKVLFKAQGKGGRQIVVGRDWLSNNGVNMATGLVMAVSTLLGAVGYIGGFRR